ncbi:MAG: aminopeptidase [Coriobacteriales bacterium]|jgi:aminopeptidase|nr:aminopeptidase [Coriobacteriales bacterium]
MNDSEFQESLRKYAQLVVRKGCNIRPGQEFMISANIDTIEFIRLLTAEAYAAGAKRVTVRLSDEPLTKLGLDHMAVETFEQFPEWLAVMHNFTARTGGASLRVESADPQAMTGVDPRKLVANQRAAHQACKEYYDAVDHGRLVWSIVGAASPAWASRVYPDLDSDEATRRLWQAIFQTVRVDTADPIAAWDEHRLSFQRRTEWLNQQHFTSLHLSNSLGTDLTIGLNDQGIWKGGGDSLVDGTYFFPNMPTEEVFTTPNRSIADGVVYSSMPLVYNGSIIRGIKLRFASGKVTECYAEEGLDIMQSIFSIDDAASSLGEVALVPWTSPIRQAETLFYSTLFDENASCHLAVGLGFPDCLIGGTEMSDNELKAAGVNKSAAHVDFMIGTKDLRIDGIYADGSQTPIFVDGEWASELA